MEPTQKLHIQHRGAGLIEGWNSGSAKVAEVKVNNSASGAVAYKGLAIGTSTAGGTLYAANFHSGKIDTWGPGFASISLTGKFSDAAVPAGFAPFNIWNLNNSLYVEYAKQDANQFKDVAGAGNGFVSIFDLNGNLLQHLISEWSAEFAVGRGDCSFDLGSFWRRAFGGQLRRRPHQRF